MLPEGSLEYQSCNNGSIFETGSEWCKESALHRWAANNTYQPIENRGKVVKAAEDSHVRRSQI